MNDSFERVRTFLHTHQVSPAASILVGISGGPDSVWLAFVLRQLGYSIGLAHVNYHLRGIESDDDEALVREYAADWKVPIFVKHANWEHNPSKRNLQQEARDLRYQFFEKISEKYDYTLIATAHHQDDQIESLVMSMLGGGDEHFVSGIPACRGKIIRPLLDYTKSEIYSKLGSFHLTYREDRSNEESIYARNHVRLNVLPYLEQAMPGFRQILMRKYAWQQQKESILAEYLAGIWNLVVEQDGQGQGIHYEKLQEVAGMNRLPLLLGLALDKWEIYGPIRREIYALSTSDPGKYILYRGNMLRRTRDGIFRYPAPAETHQPPIRVDLQAEHTLIAWFHVQILIQANYQGEVVYEPDVLYLDKAGLKGELHIRTWQQGDQMIPFGMKGHKKLSDIFIDEKFTPFQKATVPVFTDQVQIVGLGDFRVAESVKIRPETTHIVRIDLIKKQS